MKELYALAKGMNDNERRAFMITLDLLSSTTSDLKLLNSIRNAYCFIDLNTDAGKYIDKVSVQISGIQRAYYNLQSNGIDIALFKECKEYKKAMK